MELIAAVTIWVLFSLFLLFPLMGLPAAMHRTAMTLLVAEFFAIIVSRSGDPSVAAVGRSAASLDMPLLAVALILVAIMRAVRLERRR